MYNFSNKKVRICNRRRCFTIASRKQQHRKHRILGDRDSTRTYMHSNFLMQNEYSLFYWNLVRYVNLNPSFSLFSFAIPSVTNQHLIYIWRKTRGPRRFWTLVIRMYVFTNILYHQDFFLLQFSIVLQYWNIQEPPVTLKSSNPICS